MYEGCFEDDAFSGFGRLIYDNGEFYQGEWKDSKRHGEGMHVVPFKSCKQGQWRNDVYKGKTKVAQDSEMGEPDFIDDMSKTLPDVETESVHSQISIYNTASFEPNCNK